MVKFFKHITNFQHSWSQVTQAIWSKYPNPHSTHVKTSDVVDRYVDPNTGYLYTTRLFLKNGSIPKWGRKLLKNNEAYVIEHSVCKPEGTMILTTKNLSHAKLMLIEETQKYTRNSDDTTTLLTKARIASNIWGPLRAKIESFGLKRFREGSKNSSNGLLYVVEKLANNRSAISNSMKAIK